MATIANSAGAVSPKFNPFVLVDKRLHPFIPQIGLVGLGVYHALANYADNVTRICWPRQSTIADFLGISLRSVNRGISRLLAVGLVEVVEERPGYSHVYRLLDRSFAGDLAADAVGAGGTTDGRTPPGEGTTEGRTIELDFLTANYTEKQQQPTPAPEQPALPEPAEVVVVSPDIQQIAETVIPQAVQETAQAPTAPSETETLAEALPLPKKAAVTLLERAPAADRQAIVETFHAAHASRSILKPAAYLAALVRAAINGTLTPESAQQANQAKQAEQAKKKEEEIRRRNAEAVERSNAEMYRRAMVRLGLLPDDGTGGTSTGSGQAPAVDKEKRQKNASKWAAVRAALHGGVVAPAMSDG